MKGSALCAGAFPPPLPQFDPMLTSEKHLELFRFNAHLVAMIDSNLEEVAFETSSTYYNLSSLSFRKPRTTTTSLDGCIFDTFVCHTYQMALSKYAFGMLTQEKIHDYVALFSIQRNPTYHII